MIQHLSWEDVAELENSALNLICGGWASTIGFRTVIGVSQYRENVLRYFFIVLRYIVFLTFSVNSNEFLNIPLNFEPYVIESELYTCMHNSMETFYKGKNVTGIHLMDLQLLQDKN